MMLGARTEAWAKRGGGVPTARDYVQDGLIAMWDGIENAGWGKHSEQASCIDLTGTNESIKNYFSQEVDSFWLQGNTIPVRIGNQLLSAIASATFTFESYLDISTFSRWNYVISAKYSSDWLKFSMRYNISTSILSSQKIMNANLNSISEGKNRISFTSELGGNGVIYENEKTKTFQAMTETEQISDQTLYFGSLKNYGMYGCNCKVHCVRFYERTLTADEIAANYAIDKARFNQT